MHRFLMTVLVAGAVLVLVGPAGGRPVGSAGVITKADPVGDVKAPGLTAAERKAVDIVSVTVAGEEGLGLSADVKFNANFVKYGGYGHLRNTVVGVILRPTAGGTTTPAIVLSAGLRQGTTFRKTQSEMVASRRELDEVHFLIIGPGFDRVGSVQAKVETNLRPAPAPVTHLLDPQSVTTFLTGPAADSAIVTPRYSHLSCPALLALVKTWRGTAILGQDLQNEYSRRCTTTTQPGFELTFGDTPVCFVNNGTDTDVRFENMILKRIRDNPLPVPPATGTLELESTSGFDQTLPVVFDSRGKAAPVKFNLTSFGDYTATAVASVSGQTVKASTTFTLNKANDVTTC